jgi:hypothetical protein
MRDLHSNIKVTTHLVPLVLNNDAEGTPATGIDTKGFDSLEFVVVLGDSGDTLSGSVLLDLRLQHSDDNTNWVDVSSVDDVLIGSNPRTTTISGTGVFATIDAPAEDQTHFRIGYRGTRRYARILIDTTGTHTNGTPATVIAIQSSAALAPTLDA